MVAAQRIGILMLRVAQGLQACIYCESNRALAPEVDSVGFQLTRDALQ
jgi:hypothetical protein